MRRAVSLVSLLVAAGLAGQPLLAQTPAAPTAGIEKTFDATIDPKEMGGWMKVMAAEPNHVSAPHDKANAEYVLKQFKDWGWDARIETFNVLYPTPLKVSLEMVKPAFKATLTEKPVPGDASSSRTKDQLPAYVAFRGLLSMSTISFWASDIAVRQPCDCVWAFGRGSYPAI
jgi:N-acetylated-alpha-linked acidic dipeptidase